PVAPEPDDIYVPNRFSSPPDHLQPLLNVGQRSLVSTLARFCIGVLLFVALASLAYNKQRLPLLGEHLDLSKVGWPSEPKPVDPPPAQSAVQQAAAPSDVRVADRPPNPLPFPIPNDYGVYALNDGTLSELQLLPERVPDKRIAISTPVG